MTKHKKLTIIAIVIGVLVVIRLFLPAIILPKINEKLATASEVVGIHIMDLNLSIIRGAYSFDGISIRSKIDKDNREFVHIENLDISIAWRELFKGRILADAAIDRATFVIGIDISKLNAGTTTQEKQTGAADIVAKIIPFDITRVTFSNSHILYANKDGKSEMELLSNLQGRISNISNSKHENIEIPSLVTAKADLFGGATVTATGTMLPFRTPLPMIFRIKAVGFELTKANPFLLDLVPFSFTTGKLDLLAEFKIEDNNLEGYAKPFFKKAAILSREEKIQGPKHLFVELGAALANVVLKNGETQTTAAIVPFSRPENGKFDIKFGSLIESALSNGFVAPMSEEFETTIKLKNFDKYQ